ncbi:MAG: hypothetical protein IPK01_16160 [Acidobacteria bacterium]|nr:hypothetical protein [Acidobacteriota bacterium]
MIFCVLLNAAADIGVGYLLIVHASRENEFWSLTLVILFTIYSAGTTFARRWYMRNAETLVEIAS